MQVVLSSTHPQKGHIWRSSSAAGGASLEGESSAVCQQCRETQRCALFRALWGPVEGLLFSWGGGGTTARVTSGISTPCSSERRDLSVSLVGSLLSGP